LFALFFLINNLLYLEAKISFLKLHYYYFHRISIYKLIFFHIKNIELRLLNLLENKKLYLVFIFLLKHGPRLFVILYICENIVFDNAVIYIGFLPYYSLYYFCYNIYEFIVLFFIEDFEISIIIRYYPKIYN
jgi:hypothetical protein